MRIDQTQGEGGFREFRWAVTEAVFLVRIATL
jgi:hypothetical protein